MGSSLLTERASAAGHYAPHAIGVQAIEWRKASSGRRGSISVLRCRRHIDEPRDRRDATRTRRSTRRAVRVTVPAMARYGANRRATCRPNAAGCSTLQQITRVSDRAVEFLAISDRGFEGLTQFCRTQLRLTLQTAE